MGRWGERGPRTSPSLAVGVWKGLGRNKRESCSRTPVLGLLVWKAWGGMRVKGFGGRDIGR